MSNNNNQRVTAKRITNPVVRFFVILIGIAVALVVLTVITIGCIWNKEFNTMNSIKEIIPAVEGKNSPVYYMEYDDDFWFDEFVEQGGADSTDSLINFVVNKISRGLYNPDMHKGDMKLGCTTFTATTQDNSKIFARNYDFGQSPICILKTKPGNGKHQTYSVFDISKTGIKLDDTGELSFENKLMLLAAPYTTMDGMNDAGVSASILVSNQGRDFSTKEQKSIGTDIESGKFDITPTSFLRMILEKCSNVDEAIEIAKNCDMHEFTNSSFHYHIADANGKSAIIEWTGQTNDTDKDASARTLNIVYPNAGENFQIASNYIAKDGYYPNGMPYGYDRYLSVYSKLAPNNGQIKDTDEAMDILAGVSRKTHANEFKGAPNEMTLWSIVYDLTNKKMIFVDNEQYSDPAHKLEFKID